MEGRCLGVGRRAVLVLYTISARRVVELLKRLGISYRIPRGPEDLLCREGEVFVVEEGIQDILPDHRCGIVVVKQGSRPVIAVLEAVKAVMGAPRELVVGVDPGRCHAYIVLVDGLVLDYGYACTTESLVERICGVISAANALSSKIKVGDRGGEEIARALARCAMETVLVDEEQSTHGTPIPELRGLPRPLSRDLRAALRIALREGYASIEG